MYLYPNHIIRPYYGFIMGHIERIECVLDMDSLEKVSKNFFNFFDRDMWDFLI